MGKAYECEDVHKNIFGESLDREMLAHKHVESLESMLGIHTTIGGHLLVTAQRNNHKHATS